MTREPYPDREHGQSANPGQAAVVSKSDTVDLPWVARGLWVGGAGNVSVVMVSGDSVVFTSVAAGTLLPIRFTRVNSNGTSATNMVALF